MEIYVDGGCRRNGNRSAIGAAAAVRMTRSGKHFHRKSYLPAWKRPTNQRAEISAIILGLKMALDTNEEMVANNVQLDVTIFSDSKYAVDCMNEWIYKWANNGWINSRGDDVANKDLIQEASKLDDDLRDLGNVEYVWISRSENELADKYCNKAMDEMAYEESDSSSDMSF
jgi:ribonuclease HI